MAESPTGNTSVSTVNCCQTILDSYLRCTSPPALTHIISMNADLQLRVMPFALLRCKPLLHVVDLRFEACDKLSDDGIELRLSRGSWHHAHHASMKIGAVSICRRIWNIHPPYRQPPVSPAQWRCDRLEFGLRHDQSTLSTPEVHLLSFLVNRLTARALPLNE